MLSVLSSSRDEWEHVNRCSYCTLPVNLLQSHLIHTWHLHLWNQQQPCQELPGRAAFTMDDSAKIVSWAWLVWPVWTPQQHLAFSACWFKGSFFPLLVKPFSEIPFTNSGLKNSGGVRVSRAQSGWNLHKNGFGLSNPAGVTGLGVVRISNRISGLAGVKFWNNILIVG